MEERQLWERAIQSHLLNSKQRVCTSTSARLNSRGSSVRTRRLLRKYFAWNRIWIKTRWRKISTGTSIWKITWPGSVVKKFQSTKVEVVPYLLSTVKGKALLQPVTVKILFQVAKEKAKTLTRLFMSPRIMFNLFKKTRPSLISLQKWPSKSKFQIHSQALMKHSRLCKENQLEYPRLPHRKNLSRSKRPSRRRNHRLKNLHQGWTVKIQT